ncbi:MAG: hypothetical protein ACP5U1_17355 [Desulfomonilaceae bacterium]
MNSPMSLEQKRELVDNLFRLAQQLGECSADFPAVDRNTKRILASLEMLRINLEES